MVNHCEQNLCPRDKDVTTKYIQQLASLFTLLGIQHMSKFIYMLCMKYVKIQAHEAFEMYNSKIEFS
jgi:c-di-GMP-related signal transduction protein